MDLTMFLSILLFIAFLILYADRHRLRKHVKKCEEQAKRDNELIRKCEKKIEDCEEKIRLQELLIEKYQPSYYKKIRERVSAFSAREREREEREKEEKRRRLQRIRDAEVL